MESSVLGLVLDSSAVIAAERKRQSVTALIETILAAYGPIELSLSPVTIAELVHGIYRAKTPEMAKRRRAYIEELVSLIPVHPVTNHTAWRIGQIEGEEAAKGNVLPFNWPQACSYSRRTRLRSPNRKCVPLRKGPRPDCLAAPLTRYSAFLMR